MGVKKVPRKHPRKQPTVCQTRFRIRVKTMKMKRQYLQMNSQELNINYEKMIGIIYYILGNEQCYVPTDHGNKKHETNKQASDRTCPSVFDKIREEAGNNKQTAKIYKGLAASVDVEQALSEAPKNKEQVKKVTKYMKDRKRLTQDDIYSAVLLSYQLDRFVHQMDLYPSLTIVWACKNP
jgi:hypothetical protein